MESKFDLGAGHLNCFETTTISLALNISLAQEYAFTKTNMLNEFSSLVESCRLHALTHDMENNKICVDIEECMSGCTEVVQFLSTSRGQKMQHEADWLMLDKQINELNTSMSVPPMQDLEHVGLMKKTHEKLCFINSFIPELIKEAVVFIKCLLKIQTSDWSKHIKEGGKKKKKKKEKKRKKDKLFSILLSWWNRVCWKLATFL